MQCGQELKNKYWKGTGLQFFVALVFSSAYPLPSFINRNANIDSIKGLYVLIFLTMAFTFRTTVPVILLISANGHF